MSEMIELILGGTFSLLRLSAISSYALCKVPCCLELQRTRNFRAVRGYPRYLVLREARLSMIAMNGG
jgi:hypothetical protein